MKAVLSVTLLLVVAAVAAAKGGKPLVVLAQEGGPDSIIIKPDFITFTDNIVSGKKVIGHGNGVCHWLPAPKGAKTRYICTVVHTLRKGSLSIVSVLGPQESTVVLTGGTGAYTNAKGSVTITDVKKGLRKYEYNLE